GRDRLLFLFQGEARRLQRLAGLGRLPLGFERGLHLGLRFGDRHLGRGAAAPLGPRLGHRRHGLHDRDGAPALRGRRRLLLPALVPLPPARRPPPPPRPPAPRPRTTGPPRASASRSTFSRVRGLASAASTTQASRPRCSRARTPATPSTTRRARSPKPSSRVTASVTPARGRAAGPPAPLLQRRPQPAPPAPPPRRLPPSSR